MSLQKIEQNYTHESLRVAHNEAVDTITTIQDELEEVKNASITSDNLPIAGESLGAVKSGGDVTIESDGTMTVNDNSHNHTIDNIEGLEDVLDTIPDAVIGSSSTGYIVDACDTTLLALNIFGQSAQDGTPTPDEPIDISSVGDDGAVEVTACGKNLLKTTATSKTTSGVTFDYDGSGIWTVNGTPTAKDHVSFRLCNMRLCEGVYTLNGSPIAEPIGNNDHTWSLRIGKGENSTWVGADKGKGMTFTVTQPDIYTFDIVINRLSTDVSQVFKPMLRLASIADDTFEPYKGSTAIITSALPLCSVGDVRDELIHNIDGTGKIIKRTGVVTFDGSDDESWVFIEPEEKQRIGTSIFADTIRKATVSSETVPILCNSLLADNAVQVYQRKQAICVTIFGQICFCITELIEKELDEWLTYLASNPLTVVYPLAEPQEIELSVAEMSALRALQSYTGITNIIISDNPDMNIQYLCDGNINALFDTKAPLNHTHTSDEVGLGNVPNVATNDQTPTYSDASSMTTLTSGEKLSVAFGKIKLAITNLINHIANVSNPHSVTKSQVGLGNVDNKSSETIRSELTKANVTDALGYTPPTSDTTYTHPSYTAKSSGLYKVTVDSTGHVSATTAVTKSDITALGIPSSDTDTHYTSKNVVGSATATSNTTSALTNGNVYINSVENSAVTSSHKISGSGATTVTTDTSGNIVIDSSNTTYSAATTSANGLMSSTDKAKVDATNLAYGTCDTDAATADKVVTISGNDNWILTTGSRVSVKFTHTNTASNPTLNVNGTGAKSIWYNTALITTPYLSRAGYANLIINFIYDGTYYVFAGWSSDFNNKYSNASLGNGYGVTNSPADVVDKIVALSSYSLASNGIVAVKFKYAVPASATMNINDEGAKPIYYHGTAITEGIIEAGDIATFIFGGSYYHLLTIDKDYVPLSGGTMTGALIAQANTDYTVAQVRNVTMSTKAASGGSNGQIHFQYS